MLLGLPDHPRDAKFLSPREKQVTLSRIVENNTAVRNHKFKPEQMVEALRDPMVLLLALYNFFIDLPNGGLTSVGPIKHNVLDFKLTYLLSSGLS